MSFQFLRKMCVCLFTFCALRRGELFLSLMHNMPWHLDEILEGKSGKISCISKWIGHSGTFFDQKWTKYWPKVYKNGPKLTPKSVNQYLEEISLCFIIQQGKVCKLFGQLVNKRKRSNCLFRTLLTHFSFS